MPKCIKREEYIYNGHRVILDTAQLSDREYETMLMKRNGEEIACMVARTELDALKQFAKIRADHPADEKNLSGKYAKLRDDLKKALQAGRAVEEAEPEDGGTCNFDAASISLPRWNTEKVKQAAKEAGTGCYIWDLYGIKRFVFSPNTHGQANARSRNAEAMTAALKEMGYDAIEYCQMD